MIRTPTSDDEATQYTRQEGKHLLAKTSPAAIRQTRVKHVEDPQYTIHRATRSKEIRTFSPSACSTLKVTREKTLGFGMLGYCNSIDRQWETGHKSYHKAQTSEIRTTQETNADKISLTFRSRTISEEWGRCRSYHTPFLAPSTHSSGTRYSP